VPRAVIISPVRCLKIAFVWLACFMCLPSGNLRAANEELAVQVRLIWGSDEPKPKDATVKEVDAKMTETLRKVFKWKNYFEVRRIDFAVAPGSTNKVAISEKCELHLKDLGNSNVEVVLIGKGKEVARVKQALPKGAILVPGGNAPNETAWLAILKRLD